jgi:poly(3-hydroxybutyrate) depolymerase
LLFATAIALLAPQTQPLRAASSVGLPPSVCTPIAAQIFAEGFEPQPWQPISSGGDGGASGAIQRTTPGPASVTYWMQAPTSRQTPAALVIVLHGAGGAGTAPANAMATRDAWSALAQSEGFIVAAPIASGSQGGWVPAADFAAIDAIRADATSAYDIDRSRIYLWGFSAGGHVAHALALLRNPDRHAAYAVNAGVLEAYAGASAPAQASRAVPLVSSVGDVDPLLSFAQADRQRFLTAGWVDAHTYRLRVFNGGHTYGQADLQFAWSHFCRFGLLPPLE